VRVLENRVLRVLENRVLRVFEKRGLRLFENRLLQKIYGPKRHRVPRDWRRLHSESFISTFSY
jgi:hypothetical protein